MHIIALYKLTHQTLQQAQYPPHTLLGLLDPEPRLGEVLPCLEELEFMLRRLLRHRIVGEPVYRTHDSTHARCNGISRV